MSPVDHPDRMRSRARPRPTMGTPRAGGPMSRTGRPATDAVGAVVYVSAAISRLLAEYALRASRVAAFTRREHVPVLRPAVARGLRGGATELWAVAARRLGPLA